jgi:GAF domain-containing protein
MSQDIMELARELAEVTRLIETDDVEGTLDRFVTRVVRMVPGCEEAAIAVLSGAGPEVVSSHRVAADPRVEQARDDLAKQLVRRGGPLHDVLTYGEPHHLADASTDPRWPEFSDALVQAGICSCLLLPLPATRASAGAFALFSSKVGAFEDTTYDVVLLFALHAGVAFDNAQLFHHARALVDQLQTALETRELIGQATGLLMHKYGLASDVAFQVLKRGSQTANTKLREVAGQLIEAHERGSLTEVLSSYGLATARMDPLPP